MSKKFDPRHDRIHGITLEIGGLLDRCRWLNSQVGAGADEHETALAEAQELLRHLTRERGALFEEIRREAVSP